MTDALTDTEREALVAAAKRADGRIHPLPEGADANLLVGKLVSRGLIERVPDERPGFEPFLRINHRGLKALHAEPGDRAADDGPSALEAFVERNEAINAMLARLADLSEDHFGIHPDDINWGHVGQLGDCAARLKEITDRVFREGEYAD